jgi:hypothetical protein
MRRIFFTIFADMVVDTRVSTQRAIMHPRPPFTSSRVLWLLSGGQESKYRSFELTRYLPATFARLQLPNLYRSQAWSLSGPEITCYIV